MAKKKVFVSYDHSEDAHYTRNNWNGKNNGNDKSKCGDSFASLRMRAIS
jgi:hypothetical protein